MSATVLITPARPPTFFPCNHLRVPLDRSFIPRLLLPQAPALTLLHSFMCASFLRETCSLNFTGFFLIIVSVIPQGDLEEKLFSITLAPRQNHSKTVQEEKKRSHKWETSCESLGRNSQERRDSRGRTHLRVQ